MGDLSFKENVQFLNILGRLDIMIFITVIDTYTVLILKVKKVRGKASKIIWNCITVHFGKIFAGFQLHHHPQPSYETDILILHLQISNKLYT